MLAMTLLLPVLEGPTQSSGCSTSMVAHGRRPSARQCVQMGRQCREWFATLDLKENETKDQYDHRTVRGRRRLLAVGVEGVETTPWLKILGVTLVPMSHRNTLGTESDRLRAAAWVLKGVRCLPVTCATRVRVAGVSASAGCF